MQTKQKAAVLAVITVCSASIELASAKPPPPPPPPPPVTVTIVPIPGFSDRYPDKVIIKTESSNRVKSNAQIWTQGTGSKRSSGGSAHITFPF